MSHLFSPLQIRDITTKNRIVVSPMCQYSAINGLANDWHFSHLATRAVGGAGIVFTEAVAVAPEGRITPSDLGLWHDAQIAPLQRITDFIAQQGAIPAIQLAHAGHKAGSAEPWNGGKHLATQQGGWLPIAASPYLLDTGVSAQQASLDDIEQIIIDFGNTTRRAIEAGFQIIEVHAAHGYLLNGFLSPIVNQRTDEYGGSFDNRVRLLIRVLREVRKNMPINYPLFVRISASDWLENGWKLEDSVQLAQLLALENVDLVDCSSGGLAPATAISVGPNYQVPFAEAIKKHTNLLTGAVGMITTAQQAEAILSNQQADLIFMARELLRNPYFPLQAAQQLQENINWPIQYQRAKPKY
jgi:2,4-dienoyl-CoA reductase-like NADH-dependent reductase (Old Yellow Enzyme family)